MCPRPEHKRSRIPSWTSETPWTHQNGMCPNQADVLLPLEGAADYLGITEEDACE